MLCRSVDVTNAMIVSYAEILEVTCGKDAIEARFNSQTANAAQYKMSQLHFNDPDCVFDQAVDGYFVKRIEPLNSCGTHVTVRV